MSRTAGCRIPFPRAVRAAFNLEAFSFDAFLFASNAFRAAALVLFVAVFGAAVTELPIEEFALPVVPEVPPTEVVDFESALPPPDGIDVVDGVDAASLDISRGISPL